MLGASAGAMVTGRSIEPAIALDGHTEGITPEDFSGLNLVDLVIVPHADGLLPPYPPELIATLARQFKDIPGLRMLADSEALLVKNGTILQVESPQSYE